jgi:hypothetical protein
VPAQLPRSKPATRRNLLSGLPSTFYKGKEERKNKGALPLLKLARNSELNNACFPLGKKQTGPFGALHDNRPMQQSMDTKTGTAATPTASLVGGVNLPCVNGQDGGRKQKSIAKATATCESVPTTLRFVDLDLHMDALLFPACEG